MIRFQDIKQGDYIMANNDGTIWQGEVTRLNRDEKEVCVNNGVQEFWYTPEEMQAVPLDEDQLVKLGFALEETDGSVKYKKDSFRLLTPQKGDFSNVEMWWREDRRHFSFPLGVHELQNLYLDMTKVHLDKP